MKKLTYPILYIARKEHGHTQKAIAKKLSISPQRYQIKESGKGEFSLTEAKILSELYGMPIDQLFSNSITVGQ
ncbi:MAG: helix-turn-helix transcriptional regulator [Staphylococcus equorum]|uniref:helix-turn-helix transcriptional regulator n=1 Tax=Staphylococcus TaxID=1279 RepID=UPI002552CDD3|nr:helix-turn-helix transcriptional regulator [Staphylococcus equorum]MDN5811328.1 helix-turn-helix transcriptional regulator [Tetragenococcus koreensis]MDN5832169.1 helix-turn-helix transcriptional regulator [Tetragenococcus halophilus]MDK9871993.1 helix-turn-helix transcriptional regulator [Staphylococcus equorum]MDK9876899.1 helix-turn-helix transcriptional regulator [Staphylococcus equorum]MDN6569758.1 helix-turn-helix transcriptional regulator [Staphylococcus equorum]